MKRMFMGLIILTIVAFLVGCGSQGKKAEEETKIPVTVASVQLGTVVQSLTYHGDIEAEVAVKVFSKIPDRIEEFYVDDGDYVTKGQAIAKIFATTIEQGVLQANAGVTALKAQETNLRVEYERADRLFKEGAMSKQQYETIETQYKAIQAQVDQAEAGLGSAKSTYDDATISAPISGIIAKRYMEAGDMASPGFPIVEIVQMRNVKITFDVTETDLGKIQIGQKAQVKVRSYPENLFEGKVVEISPILDPLTRMAAIEVLINNADGRLKAGMFAEVTVITGLLENVISIPRYASVENTSLKRVAGKDEVIKKYMVFIVENGKAIQRELDVNYVNHVSIAINGGVAIGDQLIIEGQNNLRDSVAVAVMQEETEL